MFQFNETSRMQTNMGVTILLQYLEKAHNTAWRHQGILETQVVYFKGLLANFKF